MNIRALDGQPSLTPEMTSGAKGTEFLILKLHGHDGVVRDGWQYKLCFVYFGLYWQL